MYLASESGSSKLCWTDHLDPRQADEHFWQELYQPDDVAGERADDIRIKGCCGISLRIALPPADQP
eukprot:1935394-Amphidinium_carterae.1